jgi:GTP-binding protein
VEFFSFCRTENAIRRADAVIFMMDAEKKISKVDKRIAHTVVGAYKPVVIAINKMDLAAGIASESYDTYIDAYLPGLGFAPLSFLSVKNGSNVWGTIELAYDLLAQADLRIETPRLNDVIQAAEHKHPPPTVANKRPKLFYAVQTGFRPVTISLFARHHKDIAPDYIRYIENTIRNQFNCKEIPVKIELKENKRNK